MERVLWPMEPVLPRIASLFTNSIFADRERSGRGRSSLDEEDVPENGGSQDKASIGGYLMADHTDATQTYSVEPLEPDVLL